MFPARQLAAALRMMRRPWRGRGRGPPLTSAVGEEHGAAVLAGRALPPGLAGKWWALDEELRAARRDLVLSLDADNLPRPGGHAARSLDRTCRPPKNP